MTVTPWIVAKSGINDDRGMSISAPCCPKKVARLGSGVALVVEAAGPGSAELGPASDEVDCGRRVELARPPLMSSSI